MIRIQKRWQCHMWALFFLMASTITSLPLNSTTVYTYHRRLGNILILFIIFGQIFGGTKFKSFRCHPSSNRLKKNSIELSKFYESLMGPFYFPSFLDARKSQLGFKGENSSFYIPHHHKVEFLL